MTCALPEELKQMIDEMNAVVAKNKHLDIKVEYGVPVRTIVKRESSQGELNKYGYSCNFMDRWPAHPH